MHARAGSIIASVLLALFVPLAAIAGDTTEPRWYIDPFGGYTVFGQNFGKYALHEDDAIADNAFNAGARIGRLWSSGLGLELTGAWSSTKLNDASSSSSADMTFIHGSADLIYSPTMCRYGGPFVSGGFGAVRTSITNVAPTGSFSFSPPSDKADQLDQGAANIAAGWLLSMGPRFGLRLEARNLLWVPYKHPESSKLNYQVYGVGLDFHFGVKVKDADLDGVPDKKDKCPNTMTGCRVDATGCPGDADRDGVCDGIDKCPGTPTGATVDPNGCPKDSDGDGVLDGIDQCADTPKGATVDAHGCPMDSDGDGVYDGLDQCSGTPSGATVDAHGCPMDSDGDGVYDGLDKCEGTPHGAKVDRDGCPIEIMEKETELLDTGMIRLENINFATGKADLQPEDLPTLDIVGQVLEKWSQLKIEIAGHTDDRGSAKLNQKLSEARAQSVLDYLEHKYTDLKPEQFSSKGYGESKPLVPNTSDLNRAKNRRVEFSVLNKEVLKKEVEKRRLLQK